MAASLSSTEIAQELADYQVVLPEPALSQLSSYLELLLRWNRRINLIGLRQPQAIVRQLFGESLYLSRVLELRGWLVDIGSGAGFPGLALKLVAPELRVTLVESRRKKCAFLREVVRECAFSGVDVVAERFEDWVARLTSDKRADITTTRAVEVSKSLLLFIVSLLAPGGKAVFLTTEALSHRLRQECPALFWQVPQSVPGSSRSVILVGSH